MTRLKLHLMLSSITGVISMLVTWLILGSSIATIMISWTIGVVIYFIVMSVSLFVFYIVGKISRLINKQKR